VSMPRPSPSRAAILIFSDSSHDEWTQGLSKTKDVLEHSKEKTASTLVKAKLSVEHSLGLGAKPNVIPPGEALIDGPYRPVYIGWHPVAGLGGKWIAEHSLGKMVTKHVGQYPDPTQHWAVLVGEYVHELWMDEHLDVIYINERVEEQEWKMFEVGRTRFTDEAIRQAGEMVIHNMRRVRPGYNVISNNCQNYAVGLLDAIQIGKHVEFATSFAVYQAATGKGAIKDLWVEKTEEKKTEEGGEGLPERPHLERHDTVQNAQKVMNDNTTKLDNHRSLFGQEF
jgi:hypothetical protein